MTEKPDNRSSLVRAVVAFVTIPRGPFFVSLVLDGFVLLSLSFSLSLSLSLCLSVFALLSSPFFRHFGTETTTTTTTTTTTATTLATEARMSLSLSFSLYRCDCVGWSDSVYVCVCAELSKT